MFLISVSTSIPQISLLLFVSIFFNFPYFPVFSRYESSSEPELEAEINLYYRAVINFLYTSSHFFYYLSTSVRFPKLLDFC